RGETPFPTTTAWALTRLPACPFLGLDRELRGIAAGLRTHALVSLSSAVITISALDLYEAVRAHGGNSDPMRVIQGLARHSRGLCEDSSCYHGLAAGPSGAPGARRGTHSPVAA